MKKNRYQVHVVYKCGKQVFELYQDFFASEPYERVESYLGSYLRRIVRVGKVEISLVDVADDVQLFMPSGGLQATVMNIVYDLFSMVASFYNEK